MHYKKILIATSTLILLVGIITPIVIFVKKSDDKSEKNTKSNGPLVEEGKNQIKRNIASTSSKSSRKLQLNQFEPLDFNDIKPSEPQFLGGIQYTAYSQGFSFILNMAKQMGWNWEDEKLVEKLHDPNFEWDKINILNSRSHSKFDKSHNKISKFEKFFKDQTLIRKNNREYLVPIGYSMKTHKVQMKTHLWELINELIWVDSNDAEVIDNIDASTEVVIDLGEDFDGLRDDNSKLERIFSLLNNEGYWKKIFPHEKYAYNWSGSELTKLAFQLSKNKLLVWHYSGEEANQKSLKEIKNGETRMHEKVPEGIEHMYIFDEFIKNKIHNEDDFKDDARPLEYSVQKPKKLDQVWLDPMGIDGSIFPLKFFTTVNTKVDKNAKRLNAHLKYAGRFDANGRIWQPIMFDYKSVFKGSYNSFINGEKPGEVINKLYAWNPNLFTTNKFYYPLKTFKSPNMIRKFDVIKDESKKEYFFSLLKTLFSNLQITMIKKYEEIKPLFEKTSPLITSFFNFVKFNNFSDKNIKDAFENLNNGSHYMLGVEIFLRGIKNMPLDQVKLKFPNWINFVKPPRIEKNTIIGMANTSHFTNLVNFMYNTKSSKKAGNFDPKTKKIIFPTKNWNEDDKLTYFLYDKYGS